MRRPVAALALLWFTFAGCRCSSQGSNAVDNGLDAGQLPAKDAGHRSDVSAPPITDAGADTATPVDALSEESGSTEDDDPPPTSTFTPVGDWHRVPGVKDTCREVVASDPATSI